MIGWILGRWRKRHPGPVLAISLIVLLGGIGVLVWWVLSDLAKGQLLRPAIGVLVLAALSVRIIVAFRPRGR